MNSEKNTFFLYGALGGDMIGSVYEFHNVKMVNFPLFTPRSRPTDDSMMTLATADAIVNRRPYADAYRDWGNAYPDAGYGGGFRRWLRSEHPSPYNSWGNGSAMRVSPAGFAFRSREEVLFEAEKSATCTHNHPEGIKGAQAVAYAVFLARTGASKKEIAQEIASAFRYDLSEPLDSLRKWYSFDVSCQGTLPVALRAFLESDSYLSAVRNAVSLGGDSDTIGAITGAIALAFYGEMPLEIALEIEKRLDHRMLKMCADFQNFCGQGTASPAR